MKPFEEGLEDVVQRGVLPEEGTSADHYLKANPVEREEVVQMIELSRQIRQEFGLSAEERESLEPSAGFYARVMARIEAEKAIPSFWSFFLEPFGRRLVYASLVLAGLLFAATAFDSTANPEQDVAAGSSAQTLHGAVLASDSTDMPLVESDDPNRDRGTALMQLTTYDQ